MNFPKKIQQIQNGYFNAIHLHQADDAPRQTHFIKTKNPALAGFF